MKSSKKPVVSIVIPTLNSQRTLQFCLDSISQQSYKGFVEIIIADGGSTDSTVKIAAKFGAKIVKNKLRTGEAGKAIGVKYAKGQILAFIDSDNVLPDENWLSKMIQPFLDSDEIVATEPLYFTYRKDDHWLTRYFALLGMGDPLNLFIGNYDRYSFISDKWTELPIKFIDREDYLILLLKKEFPTIGANGFLIKKKILQEYPSKDYLFDIDVLKFLAKRNEIKVAKVKVGIVHLFSGNISTFIRKQRRRIKDYLYFYRLGARVSQINTGKVWWGSVKFIFLTVTILPLLIQTFAGFRRKPDIALFFHPIACWLTLTTYGWEAIRSIFNTSQYDRSGWSQ